MASILLSDYIFFWRYRIWMGTWYLIDVMFVSLYVGTTWTSYIISMDKCTDCTTHISSQVISVQQAFRRDRRDHNTGNSPIKYSRTKR